MNDKEFLKWIYDRLVFIYGENPSYNYMRKLKKIIEKIPESQFSSGWSENK